MLTEIGDAFTHSLLDRAALGIVRKQPSGRARGFEVGRHGLAIVVADRPAEALLGDHHPMPALPIGPRRRLQRDLQALANKINGHWTGEIQSPANGAGGCQQLIGCQGQRGHDFMIAALAISDLSSGA